MNRVVTRIELRATIDHPASTLSCWLIADDGTEQYIWGGMRSKFLKHGQDIATFLCVPLVIVEWNGSMTTLTTTTTTTTVAREEGH